MAYKIYPGNKYGRLTFVQFVPKLHNSKALRGLFMCDCGNYNEVNTCLVIKGRTKSCGCMRGEEGAARFLTHGFSRRGERAPEYGAYRTMLERCYNPKAIGYDTYGATGITVSESWRNSFLTFITDMGRRPTLTHSLDRIDPKGNYCKENCRWATAIDQANNKKNNRHITMDGKTQTVSQWCRELGLNRQFVQGRLKYGWPPERALKEPIYKKGVSKRFREHLTGNRTAPK